MVILLYKLFAGITLKTNPFPVPKLSGIRNLAEEVTADQLRESLGPCDAVESGEVLFVRVGVTTEKKSAIILLEVSLDFLGFVCLRWLFYFVW